MTEFGRFVLVELEPDLDPARVYLIFSALLQVDAVVQAVDLAAISRQTLDSILLPSSATAISPPRSRRKTPTS